MMLLVNELDFCMDENDYSKVRKIGIVGAVMKPLNLLLLLTIAIIMIMIIFRH